jgi:phage terminase small subunit
VTDGEPEKQSAPKRKPPGKKAKLTAQKRAFCMAYLANGGNATKAAVAAKYSEKNAAQIGYQLLQNHPVREFIAARQRKDEARLDVSRDRVLEEYRRIAFARVNGVLSFGPDGVIVKSSDDLPEEVLAAVSEVSEVRNADGSVSVRLKFHNKDAALAGLRKMQGYDAPEEVKLGADDKLQGALGKLADAINRKRSRTE